MNVNYQEFALKVQKKEECGEWDRQTAFRARNLLAAISRPGCPPKLVVTYARVLNEMFKENIIKGF